MTMHGRTRIAIACVLATSIVLVGSPPAARAQFPGANGKIAFVRSDGEGNIYLMDPNGTNLTKITAQSGTYGELDWSPDGSQLAFTQPNGQTNEVWVMNADGTNARRVSDAGVNRAHPSWSPDGRYLAVDDAGPALTATSIYRIDVVAGHEVLLKSSSEDVVHYVCRGASWDYYVDYSSPAYAPFGARIAVIRQVPFPPVVVGSSCDPNANAKYDLGVMSDAGGAVTQLTDDGPFDSLPDWSPDGTKIAFMHGNANTSDGVAVISAGGGNLTVLTNGFGGRPRWSPDGTTMVFTRDQNQDGLGDIWSMDPTDGSNLVPILQDAQSNFYQDWQPMPTSVMSVSLDVFGPGGGSLVGVIALAQAVTVVMTITNTSDAPLHNFAFAHDAPLVIDDRSTGGIRITSGPTPAIDPSMTLDPHESMSWSFDLTTTSEGISAAHTKVTALDPSDVQSEGFHSLRFDIADRVKMTHDLGRYVALQTMDGFLQSMFGDWHKGMVARGKKLFNRIAGVLSWSERKAWFGGNGNSLRLSLFDHATALLRGTSAEMVRASLPGWNFKGYTVEQLNRQYNAAFKAELGKGVSHYVSGWATFGATVKKGLQDSWAESMLTSFNMLGNATPEERLQFEAYMYTVAEGTDTSVDNLVNTLEREIPQWQANLNYLDEALDMAAADAILQSPDIQAQMQAETTWRDNVIKAADNDPLGFQKAWATRDAEIANLVLPVILDTLIGGGVVKAGGALKNAVVVGKGAAVIRAGEAAGVVDSGARVVPGAGKTAVDVSSSAVPKGLTNGTTAQLESTGNYLDKVEGATIVQSSDLGNVYHLPNLGGVPEVTLDAKAGILGKLEQEWVARGEPPVKLAEVLKPSSPLRKANGVAKTELTAPKTGKPEMLDAGAPKATLAEANVWRNPVNPKSQPGFYDLSKGRQKAALDEWTRANQAWADFANPAPGSKDDLLKRCIGHRARVPLDPVPNSQGIQRFVTAEYDQVHVVEGTAEAKLFRVKFYQVEVVDTSTGTVLDTKTVVDSPTALPQTPDADAVALAKVVGTDSAGRPILEPLSRAEREFFNQRYIDKNIKARKLPAGEPGAIPDAAEHGATLIAQDLSAQAAGKVLTRYGIPFLPEGVGLAFLKRIAPFVSKAGATTAEISATYKQLLALVQSDGGFGKHAIVITSDSRYLGEVPFADW